MTLKRKAEKVDDKKTPKQKAGYYFADVICGNCGHEQSSYFVIGVVVTEYKCDNCQCVGTLGLKPAEEKIKAEGDDK